MNKKIFLLVGILIGLFLVGSFFVGIESAAREGMSTQELIKQKAVDVAKQIEIYLDAYPEMTVVDLQDNEEFQKIAVQSVGETGYTAVAEYDTLINRFHANPNVVNLDLSTLADRLPGFWNIMSKTKGGREALGIYNWQEADGTIKEKYMYVAVVDAKTADGVGFNVAATTYLDEYKNTPISQEGLYSVSEKMNSYVLEINNRFKALKNMEVSADKFVLTLLKQSEYRDVDEFEKKFGVFTGAWRTNVSYYKDNYGTEDVPGVILYADYVLTDDIKKIMLELDENLKIYSFSTQGLFFNKYVILKSGVSAVYEKDWMLEVASDHDFSSDVFYYIVDPEHEPARESRWTPVYYDSILGYWMTSLITPVYNNNEFFGIIGSDFVLDDIYELIKGNTYDGKGYSFLFDADKNILIHPDYLDQLQEKGIMGDFLNFKDIDERGLSDAILKIEDKSGVAVFVDEGVEYTFVYQELDDIEWYYGFVIESALIEDEHIGLYENDFFWIFTVSGFLILFIVFIVFIVSGEDKSKELGGVRVSSLRKKLFLLLSFVLLLMIVMATLTSFLNKKMEQDVIVLNDAEIPLGLVLEQIIRYEAVSTESVYSALLCSINGNLNKIREYREKYYVSESKLNELLQVEAYTFLKKSGRSEKDKEIIKEYVQRLSVINLRLTDVKEKSFNAIVKGDTDLAYEIFLSKDYKEDREEFVELIDKWKQKEKDVNLFYQNQIESNSELLQLVNVIFAVFIVIVGIGVACFFSSLITKPVKTLILAMGRIKRRDFETKVDIKTGDELEELGKSLNETAGVLKKMEEENKQLNKAKTEFLSITSHELRSPMTPMQAQLQMLMGGYYGELNEKQKKSLDIVTRNTKRLDDIIVDFLEVSRIEAARLKFRFSKEDLVPHINRVIEEMSAFMPEKKIKIVSEVGKLPVFKVDPDRTMQILRNLINNAIKFSKLGDTITVSAELRGSVILFSVADQGTGISEKNQQRIFEPFFQVEDSAKREHPGTGLGLSIVRGIVESQNGQIWVKSAVGKGATFFFTIPLTPVLKIKPIKLLFSSQKNIDGKVKNVFVDMLGPMGENEFELLKQKSGINKKSLNQYADSLAEKGVIAAEKTSIFKRKVLQVFEANRNVGVSKLMDKGMIGEKKNVGVKK